MPKKNEVAVKEELLPEMSKTPNKEVTVPTGQARGFDGDDDSSDLLYPRVKLLQALSPEVQDKALKMSAGDVINSITKEGLPVVFIPVLKFKTWTRFRDRAEGGGVLWTSNDPKDERVIKEGAWGPNGEKPLAIAYLNFICLFVGAKLSTPIILSFFNTSYKAGKKLLTMAKTKNEDIFNNHYKLVAKQAKNSKGQFFVLDVEELDPTNAEERSAAEKLYNSSSAVKNDIIVDDTTPGSDLL